MYSLTTNRLFDEMFSDFDMLMNSPRFSFSEPFPPMNIKYNSVNKTCTIQAATAGYSREELFVSTNGRELIIEGKTNETSNEDEHFLREKIHKTNFKRIYTLPEGYDFDKTDVTYKDGLLTITIPLAEKTSNVKQIEIK